MLVVKSASGTYIATILLCAVNFLKGANYILPCQFFPTLATVRGFNNAENGLLFCISAFARAVPFAVLVYIIHPSRSKRCIVYGYAVSAVSTVGFGSLVYLRSDALFKVASFAVKLLESVGCGCAYFSSLLYINANFSRMRSLVFTASVSFCQIGSIVSTVIGGVLFEYGGYSLPFAVIGSAALVVVCVVAVTLPSRLIEEKSDRDGDAATGVPLISLLRNPVAIPTLCCTIICQFNRGTFDAFYSLNLSNLPSSTVGFLLSIPTAAGFVTSIMSGYVMEKHPHSGPPVMIFHGLVLQIIGTQLMGPNDLLRLPHHLAVHLTGAIVICIGHGLVFFSTYELVANYNIAAQPECSAVAIRAKLLSIHATIGALGISAGPPLVGLLADYVNLPLSEGIFGVITCAALAFWLVMFTVAKKPPSPKQKGYESIEV